MMKWTLMTLWIKDSCPTLPFNRYHNTKPVVLNTSTFVGHINIIISSACSNSTIFSCSSHPPALLFSFYISVYNSSNYPSKTLKILLLPFKPLHNLLLLTWAWFSMSCPFIFIKIQQRPDPESKGFATGTRGQHRRYLLTLVLFTVPDVKHLLYGNLRNWHAPKVRTVL